MATREILNYAQVAQEKVEEVHMTWSEIQAYYTLLITKESDVLLPDPSI